MTVPAKGNATFPAMCVAEWRKIRGRGLLYAVLLFGACHGLLAAGAVKAMEVLGNKFAEGQSNGQPGDPIDLAVAAELGLSLAVFPVNGFVLLFLFAIIWAEDFSLGTMAMIFSRAVPRWKVFAAKACVSLAAGALSLALAATAALVLGLVLFGTDGDVTLLEGTPLVGWMAQVPGLAERLVHVASGVLAGTLILLPVIAVTALAGALSRSPVVTLFSSMLLLFADFFMHSALALWGGLDVRGHEAALQLSHWTIWAGRDLFAIHGPWSAAWTAAAIDPGTAALTGAAASIPPTAWTLLGQPLTVTIGYTAVLGALAMLLFCKRDVT